MKTKYDSKNKLLGILAVIILLVVYNICVFLIFKTKGDAFWGAYIFSMIAILMQVLSPLITMNRGDDIRDIFLGLPIIQLGIIYLLIQIILGLIIMIISVFPVTLSIILQIVLLALYLILLISALVVKNHVDNVEQKNEMRTSYMKAMRAKVKIMENHTEHPQIKALLGQLEESIRFSDPTSVPALESVERQIEVNIGELERAISTGADMNELAGRINNIIRLVEDRKIQCKMNK